MKPLTNMLIIVPASGLSNSNALVIDVPILVNNPPVMAAPRSKTVKAIADIKIKQQLVKQLTKQLLKNPVFFHLQNFLLLINSQRSLYKFCL